MLFPGHNYLCPGNPVENGEPVDKDDRIARSHDIAYDEAFSDEHIRSADRVAIKDFGYDYLTTGNWHSLVGATGLGLKYVAESVFGVQYPRNVSERKRSAQGTMSGSHTPIVPANDDDGPQSKRQRRNGGEEENMEISSAANKESASKSIHSNANAQGHGINIHHPISNFKTGKLVFVHQRLMYTKGYQYKCLQTKYKLNNYYQYLLTTPYANVPCDVIPWYMSKSEFKNLPLGSKMTIAKTSFTAWFSYTISYKQCWSEQCK